jgi:hypothetical protein
MRPLSKLPQRQAVSLTNNLEFPIYFFLFVMSGLDEGKKLNLVKVGNIAQFESLEKGDARRFDDSAWYLPVDSSSSSEGPGWIGCQWKYPRSTTTYVSRGLANATPMWTGCSKTTYLPGPKRTIYPPRPELPPALVDAS